MPSWEFPQNESSLLHAAKFNAGWRSEAEAAEDALEAGALAATGDELAAAAKAGEAAEKLADSSGNMDLWFENGRVYTFYDVPYSVYRELLAASSPGSYYNQNIRGRYSG